MSWLERLQEAAYTSPSGVRIVFKFEDVSVEINKRDQIREFPEYAGALVQSFGIGATSYPLLCVFWGDNHDLEANDFLNSLSEPGTGVLEHPLYGRRENIAPVGAINRRDDLKTAANQSVFQITFVESAAFQFPVSLVSEADQIEFDLDQFYADQADAFAAGVKITSAREKIDLTDAIKSRLAAVKRFLGGIAATISEIKSEFDAALDLVNRAINTLIDTPLQLANQIIDIIKLPARSAAQIGATLSAYQNLLSFAISDAQGLFAPGIGNRTNNRFFNADLFSSVAFAGMLSASRAVAEATREVSGQSLADFVSQIPEEIPAFINKSSIIETINFLDSEFGRLTAWNEANRASLSLLDSGAAYSRLKSAASRIAGFLIEISFSARRERALTLGNARHFIELCAELYGILDNAFDFFILTNNFTSDEIFEIPPGRRVIYYV